MIDHNDYELCERAGRRDCAALVATRFYKGGGAPQRNLYQETYDDLRAKAQMAPLIYQTEAAFDPAYAALNNSNLNAALFGTDATTVTPPDMAAYMPAKQPRTAAGISRTPWLGNLATPTGSASTGSTIASRLGIGNRGNLMPNIPAPQAPGITATYPKSVNVPGSPGISSIATRLGNQLTGENANRWATYSPQALAAIKAGNPGLAKLIDTMTSQSQYELGLGGNLDPAMLRMVQQSVRGRQTGMLGGTGNAGDYGEALGISQFGQGLRQQRLVNAGNAAGLDNSIYTPQIAQLMGPGYDWQTILGMGAQMSQGGPRLFGSSVNANDLFSSNQNAAASNAAAKANSQSSLIGAGISGAAMIAAAAI